MSSSTQSSPVQHESTPRNRLPYRESGALINRPPTLDRQWELRSANRGLAWPRIRHYLRKPFSEFMGTFILIMFGDGVVAQVVLSDGTKGDYQSISWGWGLGVLLGVYTSGISGAHINPAVTLANCVFRGFPWRDFPVYMLAQVLGAMCASGIVYANYMSAIDVYEGGAGIRTVTGDHPSAVIFCTYPASFMTTTGMFFDELIGSTLLMFLIYVLKDDANLGAGPLTPLGLFFIIFGIGACWGWETGYAINLARDFGPRLMSYFLGYGHEVWSAGNYYFWVSRVPCQTKSPRADKFRLKIPMVAPFLGCLLGGFLYDLLLFTGESPINTPYMGLYRFVPWMDNAKYDGQRWDPEDMKKEDSAA